MKTNNSPLGVDRPNLVLITIPLFLDLLLQILVGFADQFMISGYNESFVAAVGNANQILNMLTLTFNVIGVATIVLVSQYIGAGKRDKVGEIYTLAVVLNIVLSVAISLFLVLGGGFIAGLMGIPEEIREAFVQYITAVGGFLFVQSLFVVFSSILKSNAMMRECMFIGFVINCVNVLCNWLLIYGVGPFPELGIVGAAMATNIGRLVGTILAIIMYRRKIAIPLRLKSLKPFPKDICKKLLFVGIPSAGAAISYHFGQIVVYAFINTFGTMVINTKVYVGTVASFAWLFSLAIAQSAQIVVGRLIGAKMEDEAKKVGWKCGLVGLLCNLTISVGLYLCSDLVLGIFTSSPEILALGKEIMFIDIFLECGRAINNIFPNALQATGDIKFPVTISIVFTWGVSVALSFVFGIVLGWGLKGVWVAMAADEIIRGLICLIRWASNAWRKKALVD